MLYPVHNILRLCRRRNVFQIKRFNHVRATNGDEIKQNVDKSDKNKNFNTILQENKDKIIFNSYLENDKLQMGYFKYYLKNLKEAKKTQKKQFAEKSLCPLPVSLQYYVEKDRLLEAEKETAVSEPEKAFQLPFGSDSKIKYSENEQTTQVQSKEPINEETKPEFDRSNIKKWMMNYEQFDDAKLADTDDSENTEDDWGRQYGTPDPSARVSSIPCGGCGALLHCNDPAIPGYLPSEIFNNSRVDDLKTIECQRCHFLKEYNIALDVSVQPEEYEKLLQSIRYKKCFLNITEIIHPITVYLTKLL